MASGTGGHHNAPDDAVQTQPQVTVLMDQGHQGPHSQGHRDRIGKRHYKQQGGMRACSVNITNSCKKAMVWLSKLPYEVVFVQEHREIYRREFYTSLLAKKFNVIFTPATEAL
eukprot:3248707-Karenia_brevis.AAC.1